MPPYNFITKDEGILPILPLGIASLCCFMRKEGWHTEVDDLDIKIISDKKILDRMLFLESRIDENMVDMYLKTSLSNKYIDEAGEIFLDLISYEKYDIFGFSLIERLGIKYSLLLAKKIKKKKEEVSVVFGGYLAENTKSFNIENTVDLVVTGHGEKALLAFCNELKKQKQLRKNFGKKTTQFKKIIESSKLTLSNKPDFNGLALKLYTNIKNSYAFHNFTKNIVVPYIYSYGCLYNCSFCGNSIKSSKEKVIYKKPIDQIIKDLQFLKEDLKTPFFVIYNEHIHHDDLEFKKLCQKLVKTDLNLTLTGCVRGNLSLDVVPLMNKAGFGMVTIGVESGSNRILQLMRKAINSKMVENLLKALDKNAIFKNCYMMVGFPGETIEDFKETFLFVQKNINFIDQIACDIFRLENCIVRHSPEFFGIKIKKGYKKTKRFSQHTASDLPFYDEVDGRKWEEIDMENKKKFYILHRLFYLYKKIPQYFYRSSFNEIMYFSRKYKSCKKVQNELRKLYEKQRDKKSLRLKVTDQDNIKDVITRDNFILIKSAYTIEKILKNIETSIMKEELIIMGGEPTMVKGLIRIIQFAKKRGFKKITIETNGRAFFYKGFAKKLKEVGLDKIVVFIYGNNSKIQDEITSVQGSFDQMIEGVKNWKDVGGEVELMPIICKENEKHLFEMIELDYKYSDNHIF